MNNKYLMRFDPATIELAWEYPFEMASHKMAVDYATRHAIQLGRNLIVWHEDTEGDWQLLALIRTDTVTTAEVHYE